MKALDIKLAQIKADPSIEMLRLITDGTITAREAVGAYHGALERRKIKPKLPLEKDLEWTERSWAGPTRTRRTRK